MSNGTSNEAAPQLLQTKIEEIEALDFAQLKQWLVARLQGEDSVLADVAGNSRAYPLMAIYQKLKRAVREDLHKACLELLNEFVSGQGLTGEAADDLLILSQGLLPERAGDRLRHLAESSGLFDKLPVELRMRVLQTLVALGEKMEVSFWMDRFQKEGKSSAAICFEGFAENSVEDALDFITHIGSDADILDSVLLHIPAFLEQIVKSRQEKAFASALYARRNHLPANLQKGIGEWCEEMRIPQTPEFKRPWLDFELLPMIMEPSLAGRDNIIVQARALGYELSNTSLQLQEIQARVKAMELQGFEFETADASLALLIHRLLRCGKPPFEVKRYRVNSRFDKSGSVCRAAVQVLVTSELVEEAADGIGPLHALHSALRAALTKFYPQVANIKLTDYKVQILDSALGKESKTRVFIECTNGREEWGTVGVHANIAEAFFWALADSMEYGLVGISTERNLSDIAGKIG